MSIANTSRTPLSDCSSLSPEAQKDLAHQKEILNDMCSRLSCKSIRDLFRNSGKDILKTYTALQIKLCTFDRKIEDLQHDLNRYLDAKRKVESFAMQKAIEALTQDPPSYKEAFEEALFALKGTVSLLSEVSDQLDAQQALRSEMSKHTVFFRNRLKQLVNYGEKITALSSGMRPEQLHALFKMSNNWLDSHPQSISQTTDN